MIHFLLTPNPGNLVDTFHQIESDEEETFLDGDELEPEALDETFVPSKAVLKAITKNCTRAPSARILMRHHLVSFHFIGLNWLITMNAITYWNYGVVGCQVELSMLGICCVPCRMCGRSGIWAYRVHGSRVDM